MLFNHVHINQDAPAHLTWYLKKDNKIGLGFEETLLGHSHPKIDPVAALKCYIACTNTQHPRDTLSYFTLPGSFCCYYRTHTWGIHMYSWLLCLELTMKSFQPTSATTTIQIGLDPDIVLKMGKGGTREVFYKYTVHADTPQEFCNVLFNHVWNSCII